MKKKNILLLLGWLLVVFIWSFSVSWPQRLSRSQLEEKLREAEKSYSEKNYSRAEDIFFTLSESFPADFRFSYFQLMIAKCEYHLKDYSLAREKFKNFIHQFPQSSFLPTCYFMLGNITYLQGEIFESAQNFIYAYELARTEQLRALTRKSLAPLLQKWLSQRDLEELSRTNKDNKLAPSIFFWLGKRNLKRKNYAEAFRALSYYRDNFPHGENIKEVYLLLQEPSSLTKTAKVGILAPLTGDFSVYGTSLLNGIKLALSSYPSTQGKVELEVKDTRGDFVKAGQLCEELIEEDNVVCVIGPLRSESVVGAAAVAEYSEIPLITPTASKKGLASLGDFVFQLSPSPESKGKSLAEFVMRDESLQEFVMLIPEDEQSAPAALSFKETVVELGGKIVAVEYYPPGTQGYSPHLRRIKEILLGLYSSSLSDEESSFFDQVPVWVDGFFISADQKDMYDILSHIVNFNIYATIIGVEGWGNQQVLEFAQNLDREMIFTSDAFLQEDNPKRQHLSELYYAQYKKDANRVSMLGYDSMELLLSILGDVASPEGIKDALLRTFDFKGAWGEIGFNSQGENIHIPIYKLENGQVRRLR